MIVCPECASPAVTRRWIENLKRAEWMCHDCGHTWPASAPETQSKVTAVEVLRQICERSPWSEFYRKDRR